MRGVRRIKRLVRTLRPQRTGLDLSEPWKIPQSPATQEDIFYCFRLLLGRPPNREEWDGHAGQAGSDLDAVVRNYLNSLEFSRRAERLWTHRLNDRVSLAKLKGFSIYVQDETERSAST